MIVAILNNKAVLKTVDGRVSMHFVAAGTIPATAIRINGVALDSTGAIYVTRSN